MANPPRQKGTRFETWLLAPLRRVFGPLVERSSLSGINDYGDFINVLGRMLVEAKSTQRPLFQKWARTAEKKAGKAWTIIWKGDTRVKTGTGPYAVMPLDLWESVWDLAINSDLSPAQRQSLLEYILADLGAKQ